MTPVYYLLRNSLRSVVILLIGLFPYISNGQGLRMSDFVLFGGSGSCPFGTGQSGPPPPGCAVQMGSSSTISGGSVGSFSLINTTGSSNIYANLYSGGTIQLSNKTVVGGKIAVANFSEATGTVFQAGSNAVLNGNIDVKGNIVIAGGSGTVSGRVTHPAGTS